MKRSWAGPSYNGSYHPPTFSTVPTDGSLIPLLTQRFIDAGERNEVIANECFNVRNSYFISGYYPDFGEANRERINPYIAYADYFENNTDKVEVPSGSLVNSALGAFPEFLAEPDWRTPLRRAKYKQWYHEGWKQPRVSLYSGFSAINFLWEWNQTTTLLRSWFTRRGLLDRYRAVARNPAVALANERLAHAYGTRLLIQDAQFIHSTLVGWEEKVDKFMKNCNSVRRIYKRVPLRMQFALHPETREFPIFGLEDSSLTRSANIDVEGRAVLYYVASTPPFKQFWTRLAQLCDTYGIRLDAGIAWDGIPWTFVVDWFVNVGEYLHANYSTDWFKVDLTYLQFCHSAKVTYSEDITWERPTLLDGTTPITGELLLRKQTTVYRRATGDIPVFGDVKLGWNTKPWRIGRVYNATALATQTAHRAGKKVKKLTDPDYAD